LFLLMKVSPGFPLFDHRNEALPHFQCVCLLSQFRLSLVTGSVHLDML
jgi:hypothetical protein